MAESIFSHLLKGARIVVNDDIDVKAVGSKIGQRIGGGLRSAPAGMAFVDVTGRVDADADGIVFEGVPGMERPIIPKFTVPKELAGKLSRLVEGDSIEIEKQRRAGNTNIEFDEEKFNSIVASLEKGKTSTSPRPGRESGMASRSGDDREFNEDMTPWGSGRWSSESPDDLIDNWDDLSDESKDRRMEFFYDQMRDELPAEGDYEGLTEFLTRVEDRARRQFENEVGKTSTSPRPGRESGMASRSGSIDWSNPDRKKSDSRGGSVKSWDLPDGKTYTIEVIANYEDPTRNRFIPSAIVRDANGKEILRKEFVTFQEPIDFLKDYHEGRDVSSRSGGINWDRPDENWGDGAGGDVETWTLPDGGYYQISRWEGGGNNPGGSVATVYDANNKRVARSEEFGWYSDDAKKFLQDYHEGKVPNGRGMSSSRDLSGTKWKGAKPKPEDIDSGMDFSGADLTGANLRNDKLSGRDFSFAKLFNIDLTASQLNRADFTSADMRLAKLQSANLNGANLSDANLYNADMTGAFLIDAKLRGTNLKNANLAEADLTFADLRGADLTNANLTDADLRSANLFGANVTGVDFTGAQLPDLSESVIFGADTARGMSSRNSGMLSSTDLSRRDRAKLETFFQEAQKAWNKQSRAKSEDISQEAFQDAATKLMQQISDNGFSALDAFYEENRIKERIKSLVDDGLSSEEIARISGTTIDAVEDVRKYGVPSPAKAWVNRVARTAVTDAERKQSTQQGNMPIREVAKARLNNAVWDLIDAGKTDEEIIDAIRANQKLNMPLFGPKNLKPIRETGRVESREGVIGYSQGVGAIEDINARRGRSDDDWLAGDELGTEIAQEDIADEGADIARASVVDNVGKEASLRESQAQQEKMRKIEKLREALGESYDILDMKASRRSTSAARENVANREIADELGTTQAKVQRHLALIDEIRKRVEDGTFADPEWMIPFDEIADIGRTTEGIRQLSEKYNFPEPLMSLLARQVSGHRRRLDARSAGADKAYQDFADQVSSLIRAGYTRTEIASMIPGINSPQTLQKRIDAAVGMEILDQELMGSEVLNAIQKIRKDGISAVSPSVVEKLRNLGVNVDGLVASSQAKRVVELSKEETEFQSLRDSGKSKQEVMDAMNIDREQYQRLYSRMKMREKKNSSN